MAHAVKSKSERMHLRLDSVAKVRLERAASYRGQTLSQFVLSHAIDVAEDIIKEHETMVLSEKDWATFMDVLLDPPKPNKKLRQSMKRHREIVQSQ